jgi:type I restriction enzyme S subunit
MTPLGWERAPVRDLCLRVETTRPDERPEDEFVYVDISAIDRVSKTIVSPQRLLGRVAPSRARQVVRTGDVLVSTVRPNLRTIARVPQELDGQVASTGFCVLRPAPGVSSDFLFYTLLEEGLQRRIQAKARGVSYPAVRDEDILEEEVVVPPTLEQERIVEALERHFVRVEEAVRETDSALADLERLRASVLAAAVRGDLVRSTAEADEASGEELLEQVLSDRRVDWEGEELRRLMAAKKLPPNEKWKGKYKEPLPPSDVPDLQLPAGWAWATVDQLTALVQYGTSAKTSAEVVGVPVLRMGNIVSGRLSLRDLKYLPADHDEFPDLLLVDGDVLFNRTNSPELVGKAAVFRGDPDPCSFASYLIRARFSKHYRPELLVYFLSSPYGRSWVKSVVSQQVGQANVNGTKLKMLALPLPPRSLQDKICAAAESQLAAIERMREALMAGRNTSLVLKSSIIGQAIAGALVPQEATDETALTLLERLRGSGNGGEDGRRPAKKPRAAAGARSPWRSR